MYGINTKEKAEDFLRGLVSGLVDNHSFYVDPDIIINNWIEEIEALIKEGSAEEFEKDILKKLLKIKNTRSRYIEDLNSLFDEKNKSSG